MSQEEIMTKIKKRIEIDKIYLVISEEENKIFTSFSEAETYAKDKCEENDEEIEIFEAHKAWIIYYPVEPQPECSEKSLSELVE